MNTHKISIIIPTVNRPVSLINLLNKLIYYINNESIEIIVVDDSPQKCRLINMNGVLYYHRGNKFGVSSARNFGASASNGEYLIFLDDDDDFSSQWINDFFLASQSAYDLIFCNMRRTESRFPDGKIILPTDIGYGAIGNGIVIPGSFAIKRNVFFYIGGYDDRLKYAENTDLFLRLNQLNLSKYYINNVNFFYFPSKSGGSKNLKNMIDSNIIILEKYSNILSKKTKHSYNQIIGVNYMRFGKYQSARYFLLKALLIDPTKISTMIRYCIACCHPLAKILYPQNIY